MPYTDSRGRPEIIADPALKLGPAAYRVTSAPAGGQAAEDGDDDAHRAEGLSLRPLRACMLSRRRRSGHGAARPARFSRPGPGRGLRARYCRVRGSA